jgi:hypothetical protein
MKRLPQWHGCFTMLFMNRIQSTMAVIILCGITNVAFAQADAGLVSQFTEQAKAASDSQLGPIAGELTTKIQSLGTALAGNATVKSALDGTLKSLTGGMDSEALNSAFDLVKGAKLTPEQVGVAKEVGNLTSAYVVQKNFATLEGSQGDVATIVKSLRSGNVTAAVPPLKNVATSAKLTGPQKQIITKVADKYAPGWQKAKGAMDSLKKLPGLGN